MLQQCKIEPKAKMKVSNIYECVQLHLLFFVGFIDVISGWLCWDKVRHLSEWDSLPHSHGNYFFLCLHASNRCDNADLWLLDEQE